MERHGRRPEETTRIDRRLRGNGAALPPTAYVFRMPGRTVPCFVGASPSGRTLMGWS